MGWSASARAEDPPAESDEVVVVTGEADAPVGAVVLDVAARASAADELGDVLEQVPGARITRLGGLGAWTGVSLRGSSVRQVQIDLDGVPLNPDGVDAVDLSFLPLAAVSEVRVFRGRVPAQYGASPVGGLVDLRTAGRAPAPTVSALAGSWHTARVSAAGGITRRALDVLVGADALTTRGDFRYFTDRSTAFNTADDDVLVRENAERQQASGLLRVRTEVGPTRLGVLDLVVARHEGLPGPTGDPATSAALDTLRNLVVLHVGRTFGSTEVEGRVWSQHTTERLDDRVGELGLGSGTWQRDATDRAGLAAEVVSAPLTWLSTSASAAVRGEWFARVGLGDGAVSPVRSRMVGSAAADVTFAPWRGRLRVTPGVDVRALVPLSVGGVGDDGTSRFAANPGLVLSGTPHPDVGLTLTTGRTFRPPDLTELYGNQGAVVGNPSLRPESAWQVDLAVHGGVTRDEVRFDASVGGFATWARDRIVWAQTTQTTVRPVNLGRARLVGGEVELRLDTPWADARVATALTDARDVDPASTTVGGRVPLLPWWTVDGEVGLRWRDAVRLAWTVHGASRTFVDATNRVTLPVRLLHGLVLRVQPAPGWPTFTGEVRNLTDRIVADVPRDPIAGDDTPVPRAVTDVVGYPLPGRTFIVGLSWSPAAPRQSSLSSP